MGQGVLDIQGICSEEDLFYIEPIRTNRYPLSYKNRLVVYGVNNDWMQDITLIGRPTKIVSFEYLLTSEEDYFYITDFFFKKKGNVKSFYCPTWSNEIKVIKFLSYSEILIEDIDYALSFTGNEGILLKLNDNSIIARRIQVVSKTTEGEVLTIEPEISGNFFPLPYITHSCRIFKGRFVSDTLEMRFDSTKIPYISNKLIARTTLDVIELPYE